MHIQDVDIEVVSVELHSLEESLQGDGAAVLLQSHHIIRLLPERALDETQQVLLVHGGARVNVGVNFSDGKNVTGSAAI